MKFLTQAESKDWCGSRGIPLNALGMPNHEFRDFATLDFNIPAEASRHAWLARYIAHAMGPWKSCLLWVTEWSVWESSNNWPLFYKLRRAYGSECSIEDAPGHLFQNIEADDLINFVQLGLSFGWDMNILNSDPASRCFISHDEWVRIGLGRSADVGKVAEDLSRANIALRAPQKA